MMKTLVTFSFLGLCLEALSIGPVAVLSPRAGPAVAGMLLADRRSVLHQFMVVVVTGPEVFDFSKPLSRDAAYKRFAMGQESLDYLLANYDAIVRQGGGDNVRRYLGTVGTSSGLWGMSKVLNVLKEDAEDIMDFTEAKTEFESAMAAADGSAYMAIFVTTSTSSVPPEKYYADAKREAVLANKYLEKIAGLLGKR